MAQKTRSSFLLKLVSIALVILAVVSAVLYVIGLVKLNSFAAIGEDIAGNVVNIAIIVIALLAGIFGYTARKKALCSLFAIVLIALAVAWLILTIIGAGSISTVVDKIVQNALYIILPILYFVGLKKSA